MSARRDKPVYSDRPYSDAYSRSSNDDDDDNAGDDNGMKPMETSAYRDNPSNDRDEYEDDYRDDDLDQHNGRMSLFSRLPPSFLFGRINRVVCCLMIGVFVAAVALGIALGPALKHPQTSSSTTPAKPPALTPAPSPHGTSPTLQPSVRTNSPSAAPKNLTWGFGLRAGPLFVPPRQNFPSLPSYVNPTSGFGYLLACNNDNPQFIVAMHNAPNDPPSNYGAFYLYRADQTYTSFVAGQVVYEEAPTPLPQTAPQHQAAAMKNDRIAFTQGRQVQVYYQQPNNQFAALGNVIKNFGPVPGDSDYNGTATYFPVQLSLSPTGTVLAVLLSNDGGKPGRVEIYRDNGSHGGGAGLMDTWDRVGVINLLTPITAGTMSFDVDEEMLAVGAYAESTGDVVEIANTFSPGPNGWRIIGNAKQVASSYMFVGGGDTTLGGGVLHMSRDGQILALGSRGGKVNKVVVLQWNATAVQWQALGKNNVFAGDAPLANFGAAVQVGLKDETNTKRVFVGAPSTGTVGGLVGRVYIYEYNADTDLWAAVPGSPLQTGERGDGFGTSLGIDLDGEILAVGMPNRVNPTATTTGAFAVYKYMQIEV